MACRFLLGIAEAMFGPGVPLYLSYFYPRARIGFRHGVFISGSALANAYGSTLAYGITQIKGSLGPWRILFLIEGLPTLLLAVWTFFYLPDSITTAKFLTEREKEIAKSMVGRNQVLGGKAGVNMREVFAAYMDPKSMFMELSFSYDIGQLDSNKNTRLPPRHHVLLRQRQLRQSASLRTHHHFRARHLHHRPKPRPDRTTVPSRFLHHPHHSMGD